MRKYLSTIHERPESHKKRFAFAVSGGVTLMIFAIWTMVNFGNGGVLAQETEPTSNTELIAGRAQDGAAQVAEVSPLQSIGASVSSTWGALGEAWGELKGSLSGLSDVDLGAEYEALKESTIDTYGGQ